MPLVFQYGSNCLPARLNSRQRLNGAAVVKGRAQTVEEYEIAFDIWSDTNGCAAANLISAQETGRRAWGILYQTSDDGLAQLRNVEGPRYEGKSIGVLTQAGEEVEATTFLGKCSERQDGLWTSAKYVRYIVKGLREHDIQEEYIQHILDVAIRTNEKAKDANAAKAEAPSIEELRTL